MKSRYLLTIVPIVMMFSACSEAPQKTVEKAPEAPPEPVTGNSVFFQLYAAGRGWAGDLQPLRYNSIALPQVKKVPGKAAAWQALFVSPQKHGARTVAISIPEHGQVCSD